jgi:hypothetical protein
MCVEHDTTALLRPTHMARGEPLAVLQRRHFEVHRLVGHGALQEQQLHRRSGTPFVHAQRRGPHRLAKDLPTVGAPVQVGIAVPVAIKLRPHLIEREQRAKIGLVPER